jgi:hypothetical protein
MAYETSTNKKSGGHPKKRNTNPDKKEKKHRP